MSPDPRSKTGPFEVLFKDIQACKGDQTCPSLKTRQFYFEPNRFTASLWKNKGLFAKDIDHRVIFACESPGSSAIERNAKDLEPCWFSSPRDRRFEEVRRKYGLESCYITNTVKCGVRRGAQHTRFEVQSCRKFLMREFELIRPQVVVGVGGNAYRTLRIDVLPHLKRPPVLFQITHYSCRRDPWDFWDKQFPELLGLLARLRPREEWK